MIYRILNALCRQNVSAHCDIPCGIYDPASAQIQALTVIRMIDQIDALEPDYSLPTAHKMARLVAEKEYAAEQVKHEVRIIWGDYIKQEILDKHPNLHQLVHNIMMQASSCKQEANKAAALQLLALVNEFATIFWQSKNVATYSAVCPYAPNQEVVYPDLKPS